MLNMWNWKRIGMLLMSSCCCRIGNGITVKKKCVLVELLILVDNIHLFVVKIGCGFECLGCKWHARRCPTLDSVRKHMIDKGHCKMTLEGDGLLEYADFYDYSSSYPDASELIFFSFIWKSVVHSLCITL